MNTNLLLLFNNILNLNNNSSKLQNIINIINYKNNINLYIYKNLNIDEILNFLLILPNQNNYNKINNYIHNIQILEPSLIEIIINDIKYKFCIGLINNKICIFGFMIFYFISNNLNSSNIYTFLHTNNNYRNKNIFMINNNSNLEFLQDELFIFPNLIN